MDISKALAKSLALKKSVHIFSNYIEKNPVKMKPISMTDTEMAQN